MKASNFAYRSLLNTQDLSAVDNLSVTSLTITGDLDMSAATVFGMPVDGTTIAFTSNVLRLATGGVTSNYLGTGAVVAGKVATGAVTTGNIATGAVNTGSIATGAVITGTLNDLSVTSSAIATGAVTRSKLASDIVSATGTRTSGSVARWSSSTDAIIDSASDVTITAGVIEATGAAIQRFYGNGTADVYFAPLGAPSGSMRFSRIAGASTLYCYPISSTIYGLSLSGDGGISLYSAAGALRFQIDDALRVTGIAMISDNSLTVSTAGTGSFVVSAPMRCTSTVELAGNVKVTGASISSDTGFVNFGSAVQLTTGATLFADAISSRSNGTNLTLSGNGSGVVQVSDNLAVTGTLAVSSTTTLSGNLTVTGSITSSSGGTFGGNTAVTGTLAVSSTSSFGGNMNVTGAVSISSTLACDTINSFSSSTGTSIIANLRYCCSAYSRQTQSVSTSTYTTLSSLTWTALRDPDSMLSTYEVNIKKTGSYAIWSWVYKGASVTCLTYLLVSKYVSGSYGNPGSASPTRIMSRGYNTASTDLVGGMALMNFTANDKFALKCYHDRGSSMTIGDTSDYYESELLVLYLGP